MNAELSKMLTEAAGIDSLGHQVQEIGTNYLDQIRTDGGYAKAFIQRWGDSIRYSHDEKRWVIFDHERGWQRDTTERIKAQVLTFAEEVYSEVRERAKLMDSSSGKYAADMAARLLNNKRIESALSLVKIDQRIAVKSDMLDIDTALVGVRNGVIDLRQGEFRPHDKTVLITRRLSAAYDPSAKAPVFEKFLERVQPDLAMRAFLQRLAGYCLTGETREHYLPFHYGSGANGKGTYFEHALLKLMGSYGAKLTNGLVYKTKLGNPPHLELANLMGIRFALGEENSAEGKLNEALLKSITGEDRQKARRHYGDFIEYQPTYKVALIGNHKPHIEGIDEGIWRRILLVDWPVSIPREERDLQLKEKLAGEMSGILNWCIAGAKEWYANGLNPPEQCRIATEAFRSESDVLSDFLEDRFVDGVGFESAKAEVYKSYQSWARSEGVMKLMSKRDLGLQLKQRGWQDAKRKNGNVRCWLGHRLKDGVENSSRDTK